MRNLTTYHVDTYGTYVHAHSQPLKTGRPGEWFRCTDDHRTPRYHGVGCERYAIAVIKAPIP